MEFESLLTLIDKVSASQLGSFSFEEGDLKISMKRKKEKIVVTKAKGLSHVPVAAAVPVTGMHDDDDQEALPMGNQVKAPLVGTFYNAASPDSEPFVQVGDTVKKGQVLGIIEAMKLMNEIECEYDGVVAAILPKNEQMVEYGQPLFIIR